MKKLLNLSACILVAGNLISAPLYASQTSEASSAASVGSVLLVAGSALLGSMVVGTSVILIVETIEITGEVAVITFKASATGAKVVLNVSKNLLKSGSFVVGTTVELVVVMAESGSKAIGYSLIHAGEVLVFISENEVESNAQ